MKAFFRSLRFVADCVTEMIIGAFYLAAVFSIIFFGLVIAKLFIDRVVDLYYSVQAFL